MDQRGKAAEGEVKTYAIKSVYGFPIITLSNLIPSSFSPWSLSSRSFVESSYIFAAKSGMYLPYHMHLSALS